jgi:hypothetical protein
MAWVQRPIGPIKVEGSASSFKGSYHEKGRECGIEVNIYNQTYIVIVYLRQGILASQG